MTTAKKKFINLIVNDNTLKKYLSMLGRLLYYPSKEQECMAGKTVAKVMSNFNSNLFNKKSEELESRPSSGHVIQG